MHETNAEEVEQLAVHAVDANATAAQHDNELLAVAPSHGDDPALSPFDSAQQPPGSREYLEDGVSRFCPEAHKLAFIANDSDRTTEARAGNHHF